MKEKGPIWRLDSNDDIDDVGSIGNANSTNSSRNDVANGIVNPAPKLKDIIGSSLKYVGTYKNLDNEKQVVALIDDVSIPVFEFEAHLKMLALYLAVIFTSRIYA